MLKHPISFESAVIVYATHCWSYKESTASVLKVSLLCFGFVFMYLCAYNSQAQQSSLAQCLTRRRLVRQGAQVGCFHFVKEHLADRVRQILHLPWAGIHPTGRKQNHQIKHNLWIQYVKRIQRHLEDMLFSYGR